MQPDSQNRQPVLFTNTIVYRAVFAFLFTAGIRRVLYEMFKFDLSLLCDEFLYIYQNVERFSVWFLLVLQTGIFSSVCTRQLLMNIFGNNILVET